MHILSLGIDGMLSSARICTAYGGWPHRPQQIQAFNQVAISLPLR